MKATIILLALALVGLAAMAVLTAQSVAPAATQVVTSVGGLEPASMVLSGAALLAVASLLKRSA